MDVMSELVSNNLLEILIEKRTMEAGTICLNEINARESETPFQMKCCSIILIGPKV